MQALRLRFGGRKPIMTNDPKPPVPTQGELFGAYMAALELLIALLDERGALDGEQLAALLLSIAAQNPAAGARAAQQMAGQRIAAAVQRQRHRTRPPTPGRH